MESELNLNAFFFLLLTLFTAAYDGANANIDVNLIQQGAGLLDVRSSADQSTASSNQPTGQYIAVNNKFISGASRP